MSDVWAAFVTARLDETEAAAKEAAGPGYSGEWFVGDKWNVFRAEDEARYDPDCDGEENRLVCWGNVKPQSEHIALNDPARALRAVAVKRAILAKYELGQRAYDPGAGGWFSPAAEMFGSDMEWLVRTLADEWAGHPDYPGRHDQ